MSAFRCPLPTAHYPLLCWSFTLVSLASAGYTYVGCFVDTLYGRDLTGAGGKYTVTETAPLAAAEECLTVCAGRVLDGPWAYFGLQCAEECFCGNAYGSHMAASSAGTCGTVADGVATLCANGANDCMFHNAVYSRNAGAADAAGYGERDQPARC